VAMTASSAPALAENGPAPPLARVWTIVRAVCLEPCEPDAATLVAAQAGRLVEVAPDRLTSPSSSHATAASRMPGRVRRARPPCAA
jgi:hypothetical protein